MEKAMILAVVLLLSQMSGLATEHFGKTDPISDKKTFTYEEAIDWSKGVITPPPKPELGPIDKWRYESCQQDAANAPTSQGVFVKMRICREKFGQ